MCLTIHSYVSQQPLLLQTHWNYLSVHSSLRIDMNHGAPEYHSRGFETHKYVFSRLPTYGNISLPYMTGGLASMSCYKNLQIHHSLGCHPINSFYQNNQQHVLGTLFQGSTNKKSKGKNKNLSILDKEIELFCKNMKPTPQANMEREDVVERIRKAVESCIQNVQVEVFGSFKTGLYLPSSDIDIVVFHECSSTPFDVIKQALVKAQVCDEDKILVLYNATVPIIKLTDKRTEVKVDIGFNIPNAPKSASFIQRSLNEWPHMRELLMVLKQLLLEQDLHEVYSGGISSYSLTLLLLCFFKLYPSDKHSRHSCGMLLLEFLRFYGFHFDYRYFAICVNPACFYIKPFPSDALLIQDPLCSTNDVARGSYRFSCVQSAFKSAHDAMLLSVQSFSSGSSSQRYRDWLILGSIIRQIKPPDDQDSPPPLFYDPSGPDSSFNAFSSDDSVTPSSSNIDFEECDVDRVTLEIRGIMVSPETASPHARPADSTDSNPSSSSSEIAMASDEEDSDSSRDYRQSPVESPHHFSFDGEDVPRVSSRSGRVCVSARGLDVDVDKRPSYSDVVSWPSNKKNVKSHSCSDIVPESPSDRNLVQAVMTPSPDKLSS